ncbi:sentrin-specific protease 7 isoform X1 [Hippocampus zosterae]|uniref:sentrin-specific protease 7 isoform X1 n=2 Tax=Hippocampus zosterae TaxID=109293 RepID=UPI00223E14D4|nr:sentrin-specific protease 7 isoform X1 [Hippocampus zosterae]XP_051937361.1 sentrin-specific protease 7 isoform X1 [Hippocampus zosterae]
MMDTQQAIMALPFTVERNKVVSWAAVPGCKLQKSDLKLKRGSKAFDHNHAALVKLGMARRRLCLVLTDVLKTEVGKAFLDKRLGRACSKQAQMVSERNPCKKEAVKCRGQKPPRNDMNKSAMPKCVQKRTPSSLQRLGFRKRLHHVNNGEESQDIDQTVLVAENGEDYGVVDCGLSVSWKPADDTEDADEFSPTPIKDIGTQEKHFLKRRKTVGRLTNGNGTSSPKRQRESVVCPYGEGGLIPVSLIEPGEDCDADDMDSNVDQFSLGLVGRAVANSNLESEDVIGAPGCSRLPTQDDPAQAMPGEPIVLSSEDEESNDFIHRRVRRARTLFSQEDRGAEDCEQHLLQELESKEPDGPDLQKVEVLHVVVGESGSCSPTPRIERSFLGVAFTSMFCGGFQGEANGYLMVVNQKIIIPLKDSSHHLDVTLTLQRADLRRYSVWESEDLESRGLCWPSSAEPFTILLFCVTQSAAVALHQDLLLLCAQNGAPPSTGSPSPFLVLTLKDPLLGMEGALLQSLLELDCLNGLANEESHADTLDLKNFTSPGLSLDESLELIKSSGRDPLLLRMLGLDTDASSSESDQRSSCSESDVDAQKETVEEAKNSLLLNMDEMQTFLEHELETTLTQEQDTEVDLGNQHSPDEEQKNQEEDKMAGTPLYTLCRRRTAGAYTVTMCQPDSTWVKYKHQGLAHRLIQFPPPPLKGGITVTMEDLQCLDSGQYLNDVIIDFYLKYLLQNSLQDVVERSHIFSSFFYKQLTRRDNASEGSATESCQRQKRHQRVKTWTRHVDIFKKDFLFVPVNQEAHWYLVVICFPGLEESRLEPWTESSHNESPEQEETEGSENSNDAMTTTLKLNSSESADTASAKEPTQTSHGKVNCTAKTCHRKLVSKRPCILIMDSLKLSLHERIFKVLREYLQSEWEARRGSIRDFGPDQMTSSHCQVPLQDNSSDCGLYLLQYVESFLKDPVVHFDLPLHLQRWFPRRQVRKKRDEIRDLVLHLYRQQMSKN